MSKRYVSQIGIKRRVNKRRAEGYTHVLLTIEEANSLLAAPKGGRVTAEMLERAAAAHYYRTVEAPAVHHGDIMVRCWAMLDDAERSMRVADMRGAFEAAGLPVVAAP